MALKAGKAHRYIHANVVIEVRDMVYTLEYFWSVSLLLTLSVTHKEDV